MKEIKVQRISAQIAREVSDIIRNDSRDNLLKDVTITGCEVTNDLSFAKVFFTSLGELSHDRMEHELKEASPYIRKELASRIEIRHTPELIFVYDDSIAYGEKIEKIIEEIHEEN